MNEPEFTFHTDPEPLLATLARLFASEGAAREVAILANSQVSIVQTDYDNWNGGTYIFALHLQIPHWLYSQIDVELKKIEAHILKKLQPLLRPFPNDSINEICITPIISGGQDWRDKANAWLAGDGVSNQGRVHSDNLPSRTHDGLLFRSEPEILLYKALKSLGLSFAPLPVFVRGGATFKRIEPDFVVIKDGVVVVVEVDGDTVHHETPAEAHERTTILEYEGVHIVRVRASECNTQEGANAYGRKLIQIIAKLKTAR